MKIDHVHFYVEDAKSWRDWFVHQLRFKSVASGTSRHTCTEVVKSKGVCFFLSSPLCSVSPVAQFLSQHPPGVADVAFRVQDVTAAIAHAVDQGAKVLQPVQQQQLSQGYYRWGKIAAWGTLSHTLIEVGEDSSYSLGSTFPDVMAQEQLKVTTDVPPEHFSEGSHIQFNPLTAKELFTDIDHVVLNVAAGDLEKAAAWYENTLGFIPQQKFTIQTEHSALYSQVMVHPITWVKIPINEPASASSQIQEFLDINQGPGVQHIALETPSIVQTIRQLRHSGLPFLPVPPTYYTQLRHRPGLHLSEAQLQEIAQEQILIDWENDLPQALLLQIFTQPIFGQPTFFFELIERRLQAQGFGEGNFRALFEAIEQEQLKRGSLT